MKFIYYVLSHSHLLCAIPLPFIMCYPTFIYYVLSHNFLYAWHISWMAYCRQDIIVNAYCCPEHISDCILHTLIFFLNELLSSRHIYKCLLLSCTYSWVLITYFVTYLWMPIMCLETYFLNGLLSSGHICKCLLLPCTYFWMAYDVVVTIVSVFFLVSYNTS